MGAATVWEQTALYHKLRYADHGVIALVGTGQWGKTVAANTLVNIPPLNKRNVVLLNYPDEFVESHYPSRYRSVHWPDDLSEVPNLIHAGKDVVILDDSAFFAGARDSGTRHNKDIQKFMTISSHHELFFIVTIQNLSLLDISMMQSQDLIFLYKHMDGASISFERDGFTMDRIIANSLLEAYWKEYPEINPKAWTYYAAAGEMLKLDPPPWWTSEHSKPYKGVIPT